MSKQKLIAVLSKPLVIFVIFFLLYSYLNLIPKPMGVTKTSGDEPHFLIMTYSLLYDRDLNLENNYKNNDYRTWFPADKLDPHLLRFNGKAYAHHQVGLPLLLLPGFAIGKQVGAVLTLTLLTSIGLVNLFKILLLYAKRGLALFTTFLVGLSVPVGIYSGLIYPEVPLFALLSFSFLTILRPNFNLTSGDFLLLFLTVALLPIFHLKFVPLEILLLILVNIFLFKKIPLRKILIFDLIMIIPLISYIIWWASYFDWQLITAYGKLNKESTMLPFNIPTGLLAYLIDRENGVLMFAPFYIFILLGIKKMSSARNKFSNELLLFSVSVAYILFFTMYKYLLSGINPAGRFFLPIIPALAIALVISFKKLTHLQRTVLAIMSTYSVAIFILFTNNPLLSFPSPNFQSNLIFFLFREQAPLIHTLLPNLSQFGRSIEIGDYLKGIIVLTLLYVLMKADTIWKFKRTQS